MIKIEKTHVDGWVSAIRGMRNPMNSWGQSDSGFGCVSTNRVYDDCDFDYNWCGNPPKYLIGGKDLALMKNLVKAGTDHSKFMRMITVTCDITAPLYWWKEFDTYKVGTVRNSCSTMHKIHAKEFELDDFSHEHLREFEWDDQYENHYKTDSRKWLQTMINELNWSREKYLRTKDKIYWWQMIQLLPSSYNQKATVQMNYAVIRNMYHSRKTHKLDEWSIGFCNWVKTLPYSELITGGNGE